MALSLGKCGQQNQAAANEETRAAVHHTDSIPKLAHGASRPSPDHGPAGDDDFNANWRDSRIEMGKSRSPTRNSSGVRKLLPRTLFDGKNSKFRTADSDEPIVHAALHKWRELRPGGPEDLIFATRNKKPLRDGNLLRRIIYPACDRLQIPRLSWHMFRHLHGTLLSQLGVPVAVTQAQLGHADPRITLSIYAHVLPDAQRDAVSRLERFLLDPNGPKLHQKRAAGEMRIGRKLLAGLEKA